MSQKALYVVENITAAPGREEKARELLAESIRQLRKMPGFQKATVIQDTNDATRFSFFGIVDDASVLAAIQEAPWHQEIEARAAELAAGEPDRVMGHRLFTEH